MNVRKGIIAGIAAGITYITFSTISGFIAGLIIYFLFGSLPQQLNLNLYKPIALNPTFVWLLTFILGYIILAIPCGLIYSVLHKTIPGKSPAIKGLNAGLVVWYFIAVMNAFHKYMAIAIPNSILTAEIFTDLVGFALAGVILGIVYEKV